MAKRSRSTATSANVRVTGRDCPIVAIRYVAKVDEPATQARDDAQLPSFGKGTAAAVGHGGAHLKPCFSGGAQLLPFPIEGLARRLR
jgi:hypothetical protein